MTIKTLLHKNKLQLKKHSIISFQIDAELLLCFVLKKKREYLLSHDDEKINFFNKLKYTYLIRRRVQGYSVAALIGIKSFYGKNFIVNKKVLIPRPETELMVAEALKLLNSDNCNIIDIGTGSGCVIVSIALENNKKHNNYIAIDISKAALRVTRKNIIKHRLGDRIKTLNGNLLTVIIKNEILKNNNDIIITANLPYLTQEQVKNSPSIHREPELALIAEEKGLALYRKLFKQVQAFQKNHNNNIHILCEIDPSQTIGIKKLQKELLGNYKLQIKKDLAKQDRLVIISKKK